MTAGRLRAGTAEYVRIHSQTRVWKKAIKLTKRQLDERWKDAARWHDGIETAGSSFVAAADAVCQRPEEWRTDGETTAPRRTPWRTQRDWIHDNL